MLRGRTFMLVMLLVLFVMVVSQGCNTVRGVGKDVEQGGKAIQRTTEK